MGSTHFWNLPQEAIWRTAIFWHFYGELVYLASFCSVLLLHDSLCLEQMVFENTETRLATILVIKLNIVYTTHTHAHLTMLSRVEGDRSPIWPLTTGDSSLTEELELSHNSTLSLSLAHTYTLTHTWIYIHRPLTRLPGRETSDKLSLCVCVRVSVREALLN